MEFNEKTFKNIISISLVIILVILAVIIIKPIFIAISFGVLSAYLFHPIFNIFLKVFKNKTLSASLVCLALLVILLVPIYFFAGALIDQIVNLYLVLQKLDVYTLVREILPSTMDSSGINSVISTSLGSIVPKLLSGILNYISDLIFNLPTILLNLFVFLFVFFFTLRDGDLIMEYIKSLAILSKETEEKFFKQFKDITYSVLYGQVVVGIIQGLIAGIGYVIFGVPGAIVLTVLTMITAILPMIGAWLIWVPVDIYLFASGNTGAGLGLLIYGLIVVSLIDNVLRTIIISRKTKINSGIIIIGMIGGFIVFGILGFVLGPLILAYIILLLELYRKRREESIFIKEAPK